jgi:hypothetical protein
MKMTNFLIVLLFLLCASVFGLRTRRLHGGSKHVCRNNEHKIGEWKFREHLARNKTFYCCGWDDEDFLKDTKQCGTVKIHGDNLYYGSNTTNTQSGGHACLCDAQEPGGRWFVHKREQFEWVPTFCHLLAWNATQFCELLGSQTILFVGDSTMQQTMGTLTSMITSSGGHCANQIAHGRSDLLYFSGHGHDNLFQHTMKMKPDILIMTVGAWLHDMGDFWSVFENLKYRWKELLAAVPNLRVVYKTQNPHTYHPNVGGDPDPVWAPEPEGGDWYHYNLFPTFDQVAYNYSKQMNFTMLDMSPLYLRRDAHSVSDGMHFCLPGPVNLFSNILLTQLYNGEI